MPTKERTSYFIKSTCNGEANQINYSLLVFNNIKAVFVLMPYLLARKYKFQKFFSYLRKKLVDGNQKPIRQEY